MTPTAVFPEPDRTEKLAATINDLLNDEAQMSALGAAALHRVERFMSQTRARQILESIESLS